MQAPSVLFLCTMNYYRSRFAHLYFNHLAEGTGLHADSRGLMTDAYHLPGISRQAVNALTKAGVVLSDRDYRNPILATPYDLEQAHLVIAMYRREHEPMVLQRFRRHRALVTYWDIQDLDEAPASHALTLCMQQVETLFTRLATQQKKMPGSQ